MAKNYEEIAKEVVEAVGGRENVHLLIVRQGLE
jgi:hypothetical protein